MNSSTPTSGMMDPTCIDVSDIDTLFKPMEADLFQQLYLSMTNNNNDNPGLMTPMENDWHQFDLLGPNQHGDSSSTSIQDMLLTSPSSINDTMLTPSSSPEVLFNSLVVDASPLLASSSNFHQDLITLPPSSITTQEISTISTTTILNDTIDNKINNSNENKKKKKVANHTTTTTTTATSSSPLEMMLTLDTPLKTSLSSSLTKISKDKPKKKVTPPAASLPVSSHIMSASTPTFTLKQSNGNNKKRTHSAAAASSSSIVLNNKDSASLSSSSTNVTTTVNNNGKDMNSSSPSISDNNIPAELALKRQRNTDAARRSRLRKVQKMESLSSRVNELESIHQQLLIRLAALETDKSILLKNEANYQSRIEQLESELTDAHVKLAQL